MKKHCQVKVRNIHHYLLAVFNYSAYLIVFFFFGLVGCAADVPTNEVSSIQITEVSVPSILDLVPNGRVTFSGKGFVQGDQISLIDALDANRIFKVLLDSVSTVSGGFKLPDGVTTGKYNITVSRAKQSIGLGSIYLNLKPFVSIPDRMGMTVKGVVFCNGEGIANVVVSDGVEVVLTDSSGIYYLASKKKNGMVFLSVPGNYEVACEGNLPQYFKRLSGGTAVEQKDFSLISVDNSNHVVLALADLHLANRNDDLSQFNAGFINDANNLIKQQEAAGKKVYALTLGDISWDLYWYENKFDLSHCMVSLQSLDCPIFNTIGNHDNNPYCANDWLAEQSYRNLVGPTYYSFNLGNAHYVVLDNVQYVNSGGANGVVGDRSYNDVLVSEQLDWLKKDLALVKDPTAPLYIAMHIPLYKNPTSLNVDNTLPLSFVLSNGASLTSCLSGFSKVHILSGHTHINSTVEPASNIMEHNIAAVCATWWWTGKSGYAGNHISKDGSPGGYKVFETNGTTMKWFYKAIGYDADYRFRTYDLNKVWINAATYAPASTDGLLAPYADGYSNQNINNEVLINVWEYNSKWGIEVTENGKLLKVERVVAMDPLHIISYEAKRLNVGATPTIAFNTIPSAHFFKVLASSGSSTLIIKVTDGFGHVTSETMIRPKALTCSMR